MDGLILTGSHGHQLPAAVIGSSPMNGGLRAAVVGTALGCGLVAGAFFAFSSFVMPRR